MKQQTDADIHIIDDDQSTREALEWLLDSLDYRIATYQSAEDFLLKCHFDRVGCLILDVRMPGINGLELLEKLNDENTSLKTIILTGHGDVPMAVRAMSQGAFYFMQKPVNGDELVEKLNQALSASQHAYDSNKFLTSIKEHYSQLTPREREVAQLVIEGNINKVIAAKLNIVERTVEVHRKHVMEKMEAKSLAEMIQMIQALQSDKQ